MEKRVSGGTAATVARKAAPRLVLAGSVGGWAAKFRELGWDVTSVPHGDDVRKVAQKLKPTAVVLPVDHGDETGLLICAKLVRAVPMCRVVIVGPAEEELERFALFAGAASYVDADGPFEDLTRAITGQSVWED